MPGFHVTIAMMGRCGYQLSENVIIYGPKALSRYFEAVGIPYDTWPAGCLTIMSTPSQDWRDYTLYYSWHPWHAMPYSHNAYSCAGRLGDAIVEWQAAFTRMVGFPMSRMPLHLCDTQGFINNFVRPMSENNFRLSFVMATYLEGICDIYTRFSGDFPEDLYQNMQAPLADPRLWYTLLAEPTATRRTMRISHGDLHYVPPRLQDVRVVVEARL